MDQTDHSDEFVEDGPDDPSTYWLRPLLPQGWGSIMDVSKELNNVLTSPANKDMVRERWKTHRKSPKISERRTFLQTDLRINFEEKGWQKFWENASIKVAKIDNELILIIDDNMSHVLIFQCLIIKITNVSIKSPIFFSLFILYSVNFSYLK